MAKPWMTYGHLTHLNVTIFFVLTSYTLMTYDVTNDTHMNSYVGGMYMNDSVDKRAGMGKNFWILWSGTALANLGDGIAKFLLPVLAAKTTTSPALVAGVAFLSTLPWLLFSLPIGAIVDRVNRRNLIMVVNGTRATALACLFFAAAGGWLSIPLLYVIAFVTGVCETFADTASGSLVPAVVPKEKRERANASIYSIENLMNSFVGGPAAGFLLSVSMALTVLSGSLTYLLTVIILCFLRGQFQPRRTGRSSLRADIAEGVRFLWHHRILRTLALMVAVMSACWSAFFSLLVLYAVAPGPLGMNEFGYSLLLTALAAGSLAGAALVAPIQRMLGQRWLLGIDIAGTIAMLAVPAMTANIWLVSAAIFWGGFGGATWSVAVATIRQNLIPDELLGRVYAAYRLIGWGTLSLGAFTAGIAAEWVGIPAVFMGGALLCLTLILPMTRVLTKEHLQEAGAATQRVPA